MRADSSAEWDVSKPSCFIVLADSKLRRLHVSIKSRAAARDTVVGFVRRMLLPNDSAKLRPDLGWCGTNR